MRYGKEWNYCPKGLNFSWTIFPSFFCHPLSFIVSHVLPTSFECVLFWCFALSEALLKAFVHPGNSHMYGFSPVWDLRCVFKFSNLLYAFQHPSNWNKTRIKTGIKSDYDEKNTCIKTPGQTHLTRTEVVIAELTLASIKLFWFLHGYYLKK